MQSTAQQADIASEMLESLVASLTPESLRSFASFQASKRVQVRVDELARKCNAGTMSDTEQAEYEAYVQVGNILSIMKAKAKRTLGESDG